MAQKEKKRQWSGKTGGTSWMQRSLVTMMRRIDPRVLYGIMAFVVPFYMVFSHKGYMSQWHFFRRRMKYGRIKSFICVYKNHFRFGQVILDRFAAFAGRKFSISVEGQEIFDKYAMQEKGVMLLGSHVGNYELSGYSLVSDKKSINAVVFAGETETMMQNRKNILSGHNMNLIPVKEDMSHLFAINNALEKGDMVSIHADRAVGKTKKFQCSFFGSEAGFPAGPFTIAARRGIPMMALFVMKERHDAYRIYIKDISETCKTVSGENTSAYEAARIFASELENIVRQYPCQWFNYYEFWNED